MRPNVFGFIVGHLTLLFGFRWHGHVVELIHQPYTGRQKETMVTSHFNKSHFNNLMSTFRNATHKLSIMGVEVHGLCVSLCRGMDFIR